MPDKPLKDLLNKINKELTSGASKEGFDKPLKTLENVSTKLQTWLQNNPSHPNRLSIRDFWASVNEKKQDLLDVKAHKYGSEHQKHSEVRLIYALEDGKLTAKVDRTEKAEAAIAKTSSRQAREVTDPLQQQMEAIVHEIAKKDFRFGIKGGTETVVFNESGKEEVKKLPKTLAAVVNVINQAREKSANADWRIVSEKVKEIVDKSLDRNVLSIFSGRSKDTQHYYRTLKGELQDIVRQGQGDVTPASGNERTPNPKRSQ